MNLTEILRLGLCKGYIRAADEFPGLEAINSSLTDCLESTLHPRPKRVFISPKGYL